MALYIPLKWNTISTDVILKCGDVEINAHKFVLSAASSYFLKMFEGKFSESKTNAIDLHLPGGQLKAIVSAIYDEEIEIDEENIIQILVDADFLALETLATFANDLLLQLIPKNPSNLLLFVEKAIFFNQENLLSKLIPFLKKYWPSIYSNPGVKFLAPNLVLEIINSEEVKKGTNKNLSTESLNNYIKSRKVYQEIGEKTINYLYSSISYSQISFDAIRAIKEIHPNVVIPIEKLEETRTAECKECHKIVDIFSNSSCKTIKTHTGQINNSGYSSVNYSCCSKLEPCKTIQIPHRFAD